jgi:hypothetical protein
VSGASTGVTPTLLVEYAGSMTELRGDRAFSFGRLGDLQIDDNPYLHRILGLFVFRNGLWWLVNAGTRIPLELADCVSASIVTIKPGAESPIHFPEALVRFSAGKIKYEIELTIDDPMIERMPLPMVTGADTITLADLPMTLDQLRLILVLAEPALTDPFARELRIPSNKQAAQRLGWTITRFNRKLDNVCQKLAKNGVPGLHGDIGDLAADRRRRLVEYAVQSRIVTTDDLHLLGDASG